MSMSRAPGTPCGTAFNGDTVLTASFTSVAVVGFAWAGEAVCDGGVGGIGGAFPALSDTDRCVLSVRGSASVLD